MDEFTIVKIPECCRHLSLLKEGAVIDSSMLEAALVGDAIMPGTVLESNASGHVMIYRREDGYLHLARVYLDGGCWLIDESAPWANLS